MFDRTINSFYKDLKSLPITLRELIFHSFTHRDENSNVIYSHIGEEFVSINLPALRKITSAISEKIIALGLKTGDTVLLASFSSSNELANALIFAGAASIGLRVFIPMFPEPLEFENWKEKTNFACVIMPYMETLQSKGYDREKEVIYAIQNKCKEFNVPFLDSQSTFSVYDIIKKALDEPDKPDEKSIPQADISPKTEAVIFTTSGSSGVSKLLVYTHEGLVNCCQAWQECDLFRKELFGNPGLSPLFTHTIGIRTFLNSIWSGNPFCLIMTDWFLKKPEVVRCLMLEMKLGHIIAGPAFYNTILEFFRQYPELKTEANQSLKAAISIGAPFDEITDAKFKTATGVSLMNGFGTTETLMVTLNKPDGRPDVASRSFGMLLPGVSFGLKKFNEDSIYELSIHSPFQASSTIGQEQQPEYFETGDLVYLNEETGEIFFHSRKSSDFIKDEYGVKIPLSALRSYYEKLINVASWIEWIPLVNIPGLAALIFLPRSGKANQQKEIAALVKNINDELRQSIEPFEYLHRHVERLSLVYEEVPLTRKGTVSKDQIFKRYEQNIAELRNPLVFNQQIEITETGDRNFLYKYSNPNMAELLEALKLDKVYIKGEGDYLFYQDGAKLQKVLDFVGGFGSNLLGHNHQKIRESIIQFLESGYPALNTQGSLYHYPALLAKELNRLFSKHTGKYFKVLFGNSGSEATEIALHHAYYEWRQKLEKIRDEQLQLYGAIEGLRAAEVWDDNMKIIEQATTCILVVNNCFHGYTSGARSLLNQKKQRRLFSGLLRTIALHVNDRNAGSELQVLQYLQDNTIELQIYKTENGNYVHEPVIFSRIMASIIEPVRGEGGIYEADPALIDFLAEQDFPLISDEIQCGLGRTGSVPSCKKASCYLLGKSLGGGIEKISAVLIDDNRFKPTFTKYYNSTFANGELSAYTALKTLNIIEEENLVEEARNKGEQFIAKIKVVAEKYPDIIDYINGKGLMIGIHFNPKMGVENNFLRILIENEVSGYFFAGWFLNRHNIRVLPSLSKPNSLRIEPSFYVNELEMHLFCEAFEELCGLCRRKSIYELSKFLMNEDPYPDKINPEFTGFFPQQIEEAATNAIKVGFVANFTLPYRELQLIEPDFQKASDTGLRILFNRLQILLEGKPIKILSRNLMNNKVHFTFYIFPFDTSQMEVISRWGKKRFYIAKIQEIIDMLAAEGTKCVSLGAHTSIITGNGLNLAEREHCRILTGNSLTVSSCLFYLDNHMEKSDSEALYPETIAIVGASGNIGTGVAECLGDPKYKDHEIILIGHSEKRLQRLKTQLSVCNNHVSCTSDLFELSRVDIIICCANTNDPIIFPHHIQQDKPVYIIDFSVPKSVSDAVKQMKNINFCEEASSSYLPDDQDLLISTHTPLGKIFCCAAESLLCGLYNPQMPMKGHICKETVQQLLLLANSEGFFKME
jgi:acetylornithine/succinyldiaminopimelate/putrescine aminotransferase/predicted amino acid dehydrogenase/acyl-coenzyme A synthetase/AMP-(fatty) acid ligase